MVSETVRSEPETPPKPVAEAALTDADVRGMLNRADIILTHGRGLADWAIRWGTRSYWNHTAIVFLLRDQALGYQNTFILESESPHGVDVHPIDKYVNDKHQNKKHPDLAILRFPDSALPAGRRVEFMRRVRGFVLDEIDAKYGHSDILEITQPILGPLGWLLKPVIRAMKVATDLGRGEAVNDFICSGVIQYAYCRACFGADPATGALWDPFFGNAEARRRLIVNKEVRDAFDPNVGFEDLTKQLKLTRPADFSRAAKDHNLLECVGERKDGLWGRQLTER